MTSWHSYPKIFNLGHYALAELFSDPVIVEEKIDGSQFSFGRFGDELKCRSKGMQIVVDAPEKLFQVAVDQVKKRFEQLRDGWTYRAEYLQKPKHNALAYDRVPTDNLIIFDISPAEETYLSYQEKSVEATRIGLECVPIISSGHLENAAEVLKLLDQVSVLGGQKIEGVVFKNYKRFGPDKKVLMGKHVSEAFKEVHKNDWAKSNPGKGDVVQLLSEQYRSKARWNKSIQHLKEKGEIENSPRDIGKILKGIAEDIHLECEQEIKAELYKWALPHIKRAAIRGFPDWYKEQLVNVQFDKGVAGECKEVAQMPE